MTMLAIAIWFAIPRKSTRLYLSLALVAHDKSGLTISLVSSVPSNLICLHVTLALVRLHMNFITLIDLTFPLQARRNLLT